MGKQDRYEAAKELIKAGDNVRQQQAAGRVTESDLERARDTVRAYDKASGKK